MNELDLDNINFNVFGDSFNFEVGLRFEKSKVKFIFLFMLFWVLLFKKIKSFFLYLFCSFFDGKFNKLFFDCKRFLYFFK